MSRICLWIAQHLPESIRYWTVVDVACSVAQSFETPGQLTVFELYARQEAKRRDAHYAILVGESR